MSVRRALAIAASAAAVAAVAPALVSAAPAAAATTDACVTGKAIFTDKNGVAHPASRLQVQAWDRDGAGDDLLATGRVAADGGYLLCFDNDDGLGNIGQDVYVKFITENGRWKVQKPGGASYVTVAQGPDNVQDGSTTPLGETRPAASVMGAWRVYDEVNDAWEFVPHGPANCWDSADKVCANRMILNWPTSTATGYHADTNQVDIQTGSEDFPDAVVHETGHAVMDDIYDTYPLEKTVCTNHIVGNLMSPACAWDEGFADWFAVAVDGDPVLELPTTSGNLDSPQWNSLGFADGDAVEGRVAGALLDLSDSLNALGSDDWDRTHEGGSNILTTLVRSGDPTNYPGRSPIRSFKEFWAQRTMDQFDTSVNGGLASIYQNTIDYGYREPLGDYAPLSRPVPVSDHHYTFSTRTNYWSVVAMRPDQDYELQLYDDVSKTFLSSGPQSGGNAEFVAIDSNAGRMPLPHAYEARVVNRTGIDSGNPYTVELAQGGDGIFVGSTQTITMKASDIVAVRDLRLNAGQTATITVKSNNGQSAQAFLMASDPAVPGSWTPSRNAAVAQATSGDPSTPKELTYTAPRDAYYGFVLIQKKGAQAGTYTVTVN